MLRVQINRDGCETRCRYGRAESLMHRPPTHFRQGFQRQLLLQLIQEAWPCCLVPTKWRAGLSFFFIVKSQGLGFVLISQGYYNKDKPRQCIKKQRHHFVNKLWIVKGVVFPVVMYGCDSWTVKKAETRRTDAFELWCWRRLLKVLWTARRSNQSILKEISPEYSLEGLMMKLKLQYFGHMM